MSKIEQSIVLKNVMFFGPRLTTAATRAVVWYCSRCWDPSISRKVLSQMFLRQLQGRDKYWAIAIVAVYQSYLVDRRPFVFFAVALASLAFVGAYGFLKFIQGFF